jgi:uridine kinase
LLPGDVVGLLLRADATTVLIDGRSGSGKTTVATELHRTWPADTLVHLDDIYPGWDGLRAATDHVRDHLLTPRRAGRTGRWQRWDWATEAAAEWHAVAPGSRLVIEGAGALTAATRALADFAIWVECPEPVRKRRALERDGATYAPHWDRWAAQEDQHLRRHDPRSVADVILTDGC